MAETDNPLINVLRGGIAILLVAILAYWIYFRWWQERTIVVDTETGALEIELEAELSGKAFRDAWYCQRGPDPDSDVVPPSAAGCPSRTHHWVDPKPLATPVLPAGTHLRITSWSDALRIDVVSLPGRYDGTDVADLAGGAILLHGPEALGAVGTLPLSGKVQIGALFSETDRISVVSGIYQLRGYTPWGRIFSDMRELRGGRLLAGARVRFVESDGATATGHVAVMTPDPQTTLMRVTAISEHALSNLAISYYFTDEVVIRPSFLEALILDPLFQILIMIFGAIAGYGWLRRLQLGTRVRTRSHSKPEDDG
ncbi:hypothetical protein OCH239_20095 [Roseivivax halodurans JCM 10272]|uniref:Uncharacterized protein n=1 Tax=Roseivivax halodurans JCM 10272 TaxID=1449350 RepID=X7E8D3_9RHOB|nr:hypothetical protein [Roseivivax halodurans]ETX11426.1 hypothetical protein OCH239_20095 [Roseivivax halodurans JCM 10272]